MNNSKGFSLTEVLVAILLITGTSLSLLRHHWQLNRQLNQLEIEAQAVLESDNRYEVMSKNSGLSLLELLISLFVASLLITLLVQQFLLTKRQYLQINQQLQQSIEVHLVTELMRDSLRMAGFTPCAPLSTLQSGLNPIEIKEGSLKINKMDEDFAVLIRQLSPSKLLLKTDRHYKEQDRVLIADCYHAEVQQVTAVSKIRAGTILTLNKPLAFDYLAPVYLGEWVEEQFFIHKNRQGKASLFYKQKHAEELGNFVQALSAKFNKARVEVNLGLENHASWIIKTRVRAP